MKSLIFLLLITTFIAGCRQETDFTGYIVAKEYTPGHMSNETPTTYTYQFVTPRPVIIVPQIKNNPHFVESSWIWYIANKDQTIQKNVDSMIFHTRNCGEKVTVKY